jgi:tagatose 6-phosphate kinase
MILCLGTTPVYQRSMTFDRLALDGVNRAKQVSDYASGKSLNAARVAHTLGREVVAVGFVGGSRGRMICGDLDSAQIRHDFVAVPAETRQCITVIDQATGMATELVEESSPVEEAYWKQLDERLRILLPQANIWIFSGTLPPAAPQDFYARWLALARQAGATVVLDTRGEPLRLAMKHANAIFKLNRDEFAETLNEDLSRDEQLIENVRSHVPPGGKLIITLGASGALGSDGQSCWRVVSPKVQAVSAVGSGDAFAAGLAIGIGEGKSLDEALRLAAACGAANAMTPLAGHLDADDVDRLLPQVEIERV